MKNKVCFFEIPASDVNKAKTFYETVFDWKVEPEGYEGAMAFTTASDKEHHPTEPGGINGGSINANPKRTTRQSASKPIRSITRSRPSKRQAEKW